MTATIYRLRAPSHRYYSAAQRAVAGAVRAFLRRRYERSRQLTVKAAVLRAEGDEALLAELRLSLHLQQINRST